MPGGGVPARHLVQANGSACLMPATKQPRIFAHTYVPIHTFLFGPGTFCLKGSGLQRARLNLSTPEHRLSGPGSNAWGVT